MGTPRLSPIHGLGPHHSECCSKSHVILIIYHEITTTFHHSRSDTEWQKEFGNVVVGFDLDSTVLHRYHMGGGDVTAQLGLNYRLATRQVEEERGGLDIPLGDRINGYRLSGREC